MVILHVEPLCPNMRSFLLVLGLVLLRGVSPALAQNQDATWLRWAEFDYKFASKTVNKCMLKANSVLARNELASKMASDINDQGTYGYVNGWTKDLKTAAVIVCNYNDKETTLIFSHYGKSLDSTEELFEKLRESNW